MGGFDVVLDGGNEKKTVRLDGAYFGLYVSTMIWRELINFSSGGLCLVQASEAYDEDEYIRDYPQFKALKGPADDPVSRPGIESRPLPRRTTPRSPARH